MTERLTGLGVWLVSALLIVFNLSFVLTIVRLETLRPAREPAEKLWPPVEAGISERS